MKTRFIRNSRGQVAIFIALLFQVLFLFFAMIVNVGLLVHHKINLQNSVDLAAYYGAMKQAEVLNAIAHVNYQIRQSWKLLVWRQRVLGSAGALSNSSNTIIPLQKLMSGATVAEQPAAANTAYNTNYRLPRFCIAYDPHEVGMGGTLENSCKSMHEANVVNLPNPGVLSIPSFFNFGNIVAGAINQAVQSITNRCATVGTLNFVVGGRFIIAHNAEAAERSYLINFLSTGLSVQEDDFFELDGSSARVGIEKTLSKNLTEANRATVNFNVLNGLALGQCRKQNGNIGQLGGNEPPPPWLVPIETYPIWRYLDCNSLTGAAGNTTVNSTARHLATPSNPPALLGSAPQALRDAYTAMDPYLRPQVVMTGYEKDPWCMAYVGVKATASPKIPFMPISDVTISAEAYSKPFGGRMGPWYVDRWQPSEYGASRIAQTGNGPRGNKLEYPGPNANAYGGQTRVTDGSGVTNPDDTSWVPNIARFPGDVLGYASEIVLAYFHRAIKEPGTYSLLSSANPVLPYQISPDTRTSFNYYERIGSDYSPSNNPGADQLSWDVTSGSAPKLRLLELASVAPNLYDMAYYSIDPDYYNNYYVKIEQHIGARPGWNTNRVRLSDMGARADLGPRGLAFNIFDQLKIQRALQADNLLRSDAAMPYATKNAAHFLNSWTVNNLRDYTQNSNKFGRCLSPASGDNSGGALFDNPITPPTPGNCINGGRVGYSVKMVAKEYLRDAALELGGAGTSGPIRNPPPLQW